MHEGQARRARLAAGGLYLLTPDSLSLDETAVVLPAVLTAGVGILQLRMKSQPPQLLAVGQQLRSLCQRLGILYIVNDDPALALTLDADGVHLGREDLTPAEARAMLGPERLIGVSCYGDLERARAAGEAGADYLAFGAIHSSTTKQQAPVVGTAVLSAARSMTKLPLVAIGGIDASNAAATRAAGADWLAVLAAVFSAADKPAATRALLQALRDPRGDD
jgi:thiamine-phosphate pyrophosphorylase